MSQFDQKAKNWDTPDKIERARSVADAIRSQIKLKGFKKGFEYGCGTGLLSFELKPDIDTITLADSSEGMLNVLKEKISDGSVSNMKPVKLDLMTDPLPDERFDIVYTMMTLHHIKDTHQIIQRFFNLLSKGGYLCVADLDKEDGSFHGSTAHAYNGFDRKKLAELVSKSGFKQINFITAYHITKETDRGKESFPVFLMTAAKG